MKVFDCFIFFNEFELLELRLKILNDYVDYFVLVESNTTFKGEPKDFLFEERMSEFAAYIDKIIYVKITDMPEFDGNNGWNLEYFQRNCILRGLKNANPDDLIIMSDIDEIPQPERITDIKNNKFHTNYLFAEHKMAKRLRRYFKWLFKIVCLSRGNVLRKYPIVCEQNLYYYFLNCQSRGLWNGSIFCLKKNFRNPQKIRDVRNHIPRLKNGGWHFSYLGGLERILSKLRAINEGENADTTEKHIQYCLENGIDLYGRSGAEFEYIFIPVDMVNISKIDEFIEKYPLLFQRIDEKKGL